MGRKTDAANLIREIRADDQPEKQTMTLRYSAGSFETTLMKNAAVSAGRDPDDPGKVPQYHFEEENMVVLDLRGNE